MDPQTNPTPGNAPQPETPAPETQPAPEAPQPEINPTPAAPAPEMTAPTPAPVTDNGNWPGAFGIFKRASAATKVNLGAILLFDILNLLFSGVDRRQGGALVFVSFLLGVWSQLSLVSLYLASARGEKKSIGDAAKTGIKRYVDGFIATIVVGVLIVLSLLALIIPFFFVAPRLQLVMYYVVDKGMGPIEALKASWADTKGYSGKVWGLIGVTILFVVLCLVLVGIYLLFMFQTAYALFYLYLQNKKGVAAPDATQPVTAA